MHPQCIVDIDNRITLDNTRHHSYEPRCSAWTSKQKCALELNPLNAHFLWYCSEWYLRLSLLNELNITYNLVVKHKVLHILLVQRWVFILYKIWQHFIIPKTGVKGTAIRNFENHVMFGLHKVTEKAGIQYIFTKIHNNF